jgi:ketosteroid isomerase-like protein
MPTRELVELYFEAVNNDQWDALAALLHPDVSIQHGMSFSSSGTTAALKFYQAIIRQFDEHEDRPTRILVDGNTAAVEITFTGTKTDGTPLAFDAADFIETDGERITRVTSWYDTAVVIPLIKGQPAATGSN